MLQALTRQLSSGPVGAASAQAAQRIALSCYVSAASLAGMLQTLQDSLQELPSICRSRAWQAIRSMRVRLTPPAPHRAHRPLTLVFRPLRTLPAHQKQQRQSPPAAAAAQTRKQHGLGTAPRLPARQSPTVRNCPPHPGRAGHCRGPGAADPPSSCCGPRCHSRCRCWRRCGGCRQQPWRGSGVPALSLCRVWSCMSGSKSTLASAGASWPRHGRLAGLGIGGALLSIRLPSKPLQLPRLARLGLQPPHAPPPHTHSTTKARPAHTPRTPSLPAALWLQG